MGCFILGYSKDMLLMSLVCPRVLSPECGTGLLRPEMLGICMGGGGGRERSTNEVQDRFLVVQARRHRFDNATTLRRDFQNATGVRISTQTIRNRLHDAGLRSRRPAIRVPLTRYHVQMHGIMSLNPKMTGPQSCLQTSPGFVWTLPIDVLGYGECQMSVLLQFVWQNMIGLAGAQSWFGRE